MTTPIFMKMATWKKSRFFTYTFGVFLMFAFAVFFANPTYAAYDTRVIKKKEITRIATFPIDNSSLQGNTITKDYFVFSDLKSSAENPYGKLVIVGRSDCNLVKTIDAAASTSSDYTLHMSGLYNEWGSNYVYMVNNAYDTGTGRDRCYNLNTGKRVKKANCAARPTYVEIPELNSMYYTSRAKGVWQGQGSTFLHNGYYFRVIWEHHKKNERLTNSWIYVFQDRTTVLKRYKIPSSITPECTPKYESEDISVDNDTGDVYIGYNCAKKAIYYKIDSSVFGEYTTGSESRQVAVCNGFGDVEKMITVGTPTSEPTTKPKPKSTPTPTPTPTPSNCVGTSIIGGGGEYCEDEEGGGVYHILNTALQILTYGVGVLAVLGFVIVGTQYIMARDNEAQVAKAKERLIQIVIGLVVYALLYLGLNFLIPGGLFG